MVTLLLYAGRFWWICENFLFNELAGLTGDPAEGVRDEGVEDGHGALGDSGVRVYLLEDAVDVDVIGLSWFATASFSFWSSSSSSTYFSGHLVLISFLKVFFLNG